MFLWPGFGENSRVLEWVFRRCEDKVGAQETAIGLVPTAEDLDTDGLDISDEALAAVLTVDNAQVAAQLPQIKEHLATFGERLPDEVSAQLEALEQRLAQ
jgi:phosphoenolpyruvate carboxykinase (GTP)